MSGDTEGPDTAQKISVFPLICVSILLFNFKMYTQIVFKGLTQWFPNSFSLRLP
jgi:hypothetical protein